LGKRLSPSAIEQPRPETDLDPVVLALHAGISGRQARGRILYRATARRAF
jgi:hypothetical protein